MSNTKPTTLRIPEPIRRAAQQYCDEHQVPLSVLLIEGLLTRIGREDLRSHVPKKGRPKNDPLDI